jgi:NADH-quinone oxidoreductase subunit A
MLAPYLPIVLLFVLATAFALFSVTIAPFVGPKRYNRAKLDFYECGIEPTPQPLGPHRFPVKYFLTAMIFIVFDIEIIFLYPWAVETKAVGGQSFGLFLLVEMIIFILTVFVAYADVWRRGGLDWD